MCSFLLILPPSMTLCCFQTLPSSISPPSPPSRPPSFSRPIFPLTLPLSVSSVCACLSLDNIGATSPRRDLPLHAAPESKHVASLEKNIAFPSADYHQRGCFALHTKKKVTRCRTKKDQSLDGGVEKRAKVPPLKTRRVSRTQGFIFFLTNGSSASALEDSRPRLRRNFLLFIMTDISFVLSETNKPRHNRRLFVPPLTLRTAVNNVQLLPHHS